MEKKRVSHSHHRAARVQRFVERVLSAPFEALPSAFGDQTPPDIKVLESQAEEAQHDVVELPGAPGVHSRTSKPARRK
jgi:hypothetical protein